MSDLSLDELFVIAEAAQTLDNVETSLRVKGRQEQADVLAKLQQDVGVAIARQMDPDYDAKAGPATAVLENSFASVTHSRTATVLWESHKLVSGGLRNDMEALFEKMSFAGLSAPVAREKAPRR